MGGALWRCRSQGRGACAGGALCRVNPNVLQQPQIGTAHKGFAAPVQFGAPKNLGTTTVTGADMNRDGNPDVLQQPLIGIAHKGLAAPVQDGVPVNIGTTTNDRWRYEL